MVVTVALVAAACGNAKPSVSNGGNAEGVTSSQIVVGGVASLTGPIPADFAPIFDGVKAYLNMINAGGGVDGRRIEFRYPLDDGSNASQDTDQVRTLVGQDHVFAVVGVGTPSFAGASYLAANNVPTFGYDVSTNWTAGPSLFGSEGSFLDFTRPGPERRTWPRSWRRQGRDPRLQRGRVLEQAGQGMAYVMRRFHIPVVYEDLSVQAPPVDLTTDVNRMRALGVDLVVSCMDLSGNILLSRTMHQDGMGQVAQYWLSGYDEAAIAKFSSLMQGVYFLIGHVPFESAQLTPGRYPGLDLYLSKLAKYFPGELPGEASLAGWVDADLFVTGLRLAGRDLTRSRLVNDLNSLTSFTADGIVSPIDWRLEHKENGLVDCNVYVRAWAATSCLSSGRPARRSRVLHTPQPQSARSVVVLPPAACVPGDVTELSTGSAIV